MRGSSAKGSVVHGREWGEVHAFVKHDCIKDISTRAVKHLVKPFSVSTVLFANDCILFLFRFYATLLKWGFMRH